MHTVPLHRRHRGDYDHEERRRRTQRGLAEVRSRSRARTKIRQYFAKERRLEALLAGREMLTKSMRNSELPLQKMMSPEIVTQVAQLLHKNDVALLYRAIGEHEIAPKQVIETLVEVHRGDEPAPEVEVSDFDETLLKSTRKAIGDNGVIVPGAEGVLTKIARCCTPVPPDDIIGIVTCYKRYFGARRDCPNMRNADEEPRVTTVEWRLAVRYVPCRFRWRGAGP